MVTKQRVIYSTPWFSLVEKEINNSPNPYYLLEQPDVVSILALSDTDQILLVRQYRPALERETLELPCGHIDNNETPMEAAHRELLEETGYQADRLELMGTLITDTGRLGNKMWCYFASGLQPVAAPKTEENISLIKCGRSELWPKIEAGELEHAQDIAVIFLGLQRGKLSLGPKAA